MNKPILRNTAKSRSTSDDPYRSGTDNIVFKSRVTVNNQRTLAKVVLNEAMACQDFVELRSQEMVDKSPILNPLRERMVNRLETLSHDFNFFNSYHASNAYKVFIHLLFNTENQFIDVR